MIPTYESPGVTLYCGDCIDVMATLEAGSVAMICNDPPFGVTSCAWDTPIPPDLMWPAVNRVTRKDAAQCYFTTQPFTTILAASNLQRLKYEHVWYKGRGNDPQLANVRPMKSHETILVFSAGKTPYYPQKTPIKEPYWRGQKTPNKGNGTGQNLFSKTTAEKMKEPKYYTENHPLSVIYFGNDHQWEKIHPTQKPVALLEYLIKTHSAPGDLIMDFTMGSGACAIAAINAGRRFIGIERDPGFYAAAEQWIVTTLAAPIQTGFAV